MHAARRLLTRVLPPRARAAVGGTLGVMVALHHMQARAAQAEAAPTAVSSAVQTPAAASSAATQAPPAAPVAAAVVDENGPSNYVVSIPTDRPIAPRPAHMAVRGLVIITRHGARTPIGYLPVAGQGGVGGYSPEAKGDAAANPGLEARKEAFTRMWGQCANRDGSLIPCERGLLTPLGELQLNSVGFWLRHQYVGRDSFLPRHFDPSFFRLRSTNLQRTQLSLIRLMQGLYPGMDAQQVQDRIEVRTQERETLYPNHYFCPRLHELYIESCHHTLQHEEGSPAAAYKAIADAPAATALRSRFSASLGVPPEQLGTWVVIGDELKCRQGHSLPHEAGVTQAMSDDANRLAEQTFYHILRGGSSPAHSALRPKSLTDPSLLSVRKDAREEEVTRLGMGRLMQELFYALDDVQSVHDAAHVVHGEVSSALSTTPQGTVAAAIASAAIRSSIPRCLIFSGHDTTVAPFLATLHASHAYMRPAGTLTPEQEALGPSWPGFASNVMLELLEATDSEQPDDRVHGDPYSEPLRQSMRESLAPIPPEAVEDDEFKLPPQGRDDDSAAAPATGARKKEKFVASASAARAGPLPTPKSRWYLRLLVDHKEVSLLPYEAYDGLRQTYKVKNWSRECKQHSKDTLPKHQW